jgi:hypothetical protein
MLEINKHNKIILAICILIIILIILICIVYMKGYLESFLDSNANLNYFNDPRYEKNRTLLYGSIFLDKLDEQIKNMTDPSIKYDTKRIDIIKYSDILL